MELGFLCGGFLHTLQSAALVRRSARARRSLHAPRAHKARVYRLFSRTSSLERAPANGFQFMALLALSLGDGASFAFSISLSIVVRKPLRRPTFHSLTARARHSLGLPDMQPECGGPRPCIAKFGCERQNASCRFRILGVIVASVVRCDVATREHLECSALRTRSPYMFVVAIPGEERNPTSQERRRRLGIGACLSLAKRLATNPVDQCAARERPGPTSVVAGSRVDSDGAGRSSCPTLVQTSTSGSKGY